MHAVAGPARWPWVLSGLVVAAVLAIPLGRLITTAGMPSLQEVVTAHPQPAATRSMTISAPVTQLSVQGYGAPIEVTGGSGRDVQVTEGLSGTPSGQLPAVQQSLSGGHLSLADPACANTRCSVSYTITVPSGVTVSAASDGAPLRVFGVAGAVLDSGGGPVQAGHIGGPLTVTSEGARCSSAARPARSPRPSNPVSPARSVSPPSPVSPSNPVPRARAARASA